MEEAIAEDVPADAEAREASQAEAPLEERIEADSVESRLTGREIYQSQASEDRYAKTVEYKRASKETASKRISANKSGLERAVADSKSIAEEFGVDQSEVLSAMLAQRARWYAANSEESASAKSERNYDTYDGVTFLLFHQDPETGKVYFSLEIKTETYPYVEARGKLALHGETGKVGESFLETAVRGFKEENPDAYPILFKALRENGKVYDRVKTYVDGVPSETTFIRVELEDPKEWAAYKPTKNTEGPKLIMSLDEFFETKKSDWAFEHYDMLRGFIEKNWDRFSIRPQYSTETKNKFVPFTYDSSILPKHSGLSTSILNSIDNQQYKTQFQISSSFYNPN